MLLRCPCTTAHTKVARSSRRVCNAGRRHWGVQHYLRPNSKCAAIQKESENTLERPAAAPSLTDVTSTSGQENIQSLPSKRIPYGVVAALAAAGSVETAYLLLTKLTNTSPVCPTSGCETVLSSGYADLFGLPLPLLGLLAYGGVSALAAFALSQQRQADGSVTGVDTPLVAGAAALASTSASLMYILFTKLSGSQCLWCLGSAALSASILVAVLSGLSGRKLREAALPGLGTAAVTFATLYLGWRQVLYIPDDFVLPYARPAVETQSSPEAVDLARRLKAGGAKMYGAFWCTHCLEQKDEFGQQAMADFPYVECYPGGWQKGVKLAPVCDEAGVKAFPTWVFKNSVLEGPQSFAALEAALAKQDTAAPALAGQ